MVWELNLLTPETPPEPKGDHWFQEDYSMRMKRKKNMIVILTGGGAASKTGAGKTWFAGGFIECLDDKFTSSLKTCRLISEVDTFIYNLELTKTVYEKCHITPLNMHQPENLALLNKHAPYPPYCWTLWDEAAVIASAYDWNCPDGKALRDTATTLRYMQINCMLLSPSYEMININLRRLCAMWIEMLGYGHAQPYKIISFRKKGTVISDYPWKMHKTFRNVPPPSKEFLETMEGEGSLKQQYAFETIDKYAKNLPDELKRKVDEFRRGFQPNPVI